MRSSQSFNCSFLLVIWTLLLDTTAVRSVIVAMSNRDTTAVRTELFARPPPHVVYAVNGDHQDKWKNLQNPFSLQSCPCAVGETPNNDEIPNEHNIVRVPYSEFCRHLWLQPGEPIRDEYGNEIEVAYPNNPAYQTQGEHRCPADDEIELPDSEDYEDDPDLFAYYDAAQAFVVIPMHRVTTSTDAPVDWLFFGTDLTTPGHTDYPDREGGYARDDGDNEDGEEEGGEDQQNNNNEGDPCEDEADECTNSANHETQFQQTPGESRSARSDGYRPTFQDDPGNHDECDVHADDKPCGANVHFEEQTTEEEAALDECTHEGPHDMRPCNDKLTHRCVVGMPDDFDDSSQGESADGGDDSDDSGEDNTNPYLDEPDPYLADTENEAYYHLIAGAMPARLRNTSKGRLGKAFRQNVRRRYKLQWNNETKEQDLYYGSYLSNKQKRKKSVPSLMRTKMYPWRKVPRATEVAAIVKADHKHGGHNGAEARLRNRYRIHGLREMVHAVGGDRCPTCAGHKPIKKFPSHAIITSRKCELVMFDFAQYYCPDPNGYKWMLTVVDHFTKHSWSKAFKTKESEPVAKWLVKKFSTEVGVPERWHADNGGEFVSGWIDAARVILATNNHVEGKLLPYTHGMPRNPRCQGLVERYNRTIKTRMLKQMEGEGYVRAKTDGTGHTTWDWKPIMKRCTMELNRIEVKLYGFSPHVLLHGSAPEAPDHQPLNAADLERTHEHCHKKQVAQARARGIYDEQGLGEIAIGTHVMVHTLRDRRSHWDPAGNGHIPWKAQAIVVDRSATNRNWYVIEWTADPLSKGKVGQISDKLWHYYFLKPVQHLPENTYQHGLAPGSHKKTEAELKKKDQELKEGYRDISGKHKGGYVPSKDPTANPRNRTMPRWEDVPKYVMHAHTPGVGHTRVTCHARTHTQCVARVQTGYCTPVWPRATHCVCGTLATLTRSPRHTHTQCVARAQMGIYMPI